ncbi:TetR/AcrR family transcriptional regulator C-terminal domain-containing protein [Paractinoplanes ovalisporus]|uniref:TetR/AcrR family transcriptional regulator C-terminal domain-containing protein n=1 Tax=Paractinoplanes ovalisporus TaxID=2810368 RepID=UPI0027DD81AC|nr:TetR/AcrR family transcriptional regulator C-terminal domain-containing protein [Actinoplanes ovalisporus]
MATRNPLSRDRVLAAAVALVDRDGLPALTMRRLAADLGVEAMSLYYHLPAKKALLDGVVETVLSEIRALPADGGDWRRHLREQFLLARRVMLRHPWAPGLIASSTSVPPTVYAYYDGIVGTLVAAGFSYHLAHRALHAFGSMPLGFAQEIFSPAAAGGDFEPEAAEAELAAMAEAMPHITAMVASEIHDAGEATLGWCDSQTEFEFTLDLLLNGLEQLRVAV